MKEIAIFFIVIIVLVYIYTREKEIDEKCNVHNVNMKSGMVPIAYGLPGRTLLAVEKMKYFPNANTSATGGCSPNLFHLFTRLNFCDKCREIEKEVNEDRDVLRDLVFKLEKVMPITKAATTENNS